MGVKLIEGVAISRMCDYSFGDQSGQFSNIKTSFMKKANESNLEFVKMVEAIKIDRNYMTLFIDNIRLYNREIRNVKETDRNYLQKLMNENDLLNLCEKFPEMNFIIFTSLEDTPTDEYIFARIPSNVLMIFATHAIANNYKVKPLVNGLQRRFGYLDNRIKIIENYVSRKPKEMTTSNLLYVNHSNSTHPDRARIKELFRNQTWARVESSRLSPRKFYKEILKSSFIVCPEGNGIDCHREWEVIYLRRIPVMKWHPYLEKLHKGNPVLFVHDYEDVTEKLLVKNLNLLDIAASFDLSEYYLENYFKSCVEFALNGV